MTTKTLFLVAIVVVIIAAAGLFFFTQPKNLSPNISPAIEEKKEIEPSETSIDYTDSSGFSFSYPDNVSISNAASDDSADLIDPNAYADLQLFSKDLNGSLNLKIADTKFKSLDDWRKANNISDKSTPTVKKLGNLEAQEVKTSDRLMLAALDQGVLFTIEIPLIEQEFWMKVYDKVLNGFSFAPPAAEVAQGGATNSSAGEVIFEGEEVIE